MARTLLRDFALANAAYDGCRIYVWQADANGARTSTLAPLYAGVTGAETLTNPQRLDTTGKLRQETYHDVDVVITIDGLSHGTHETGVIRAIAAQEDIVAATNSVSVATALLQRVEGVARRSNQARDAAAAAAVEAAARANQLTALMADLTRRIGSLFLRRVTNLGDLSNAAAARVNLGVGSVRGAARDLLVTYTAAGQATVTAEEILLQDSAGKIIRVTSVNQLVDMAVSGHGGLDTGAEAGNTWYYIWLASNGTTLTAVLSASATSPTVTTGYTFLARVGVVRNDGSSNFIRFWQHDRRVSCVTQNVFNALAPGAGNTYQSVSIASFVPPIARFASGDIGSMTSASGWTSAVAGDANGVGAKYSGALTTSTPTDSYVGVSEFSDVPLITAQTLYWKARNTAAENRMNISGYMI